jgi:glutathione S-transferase
MMMKNNGRMEEQAKNSLLEELQWLNITLKGKTTRFLDGDTIKLPDAYLLPLLHLIRVAGSVKKFEIPEKFTRVWDYIEAAEETPAFTKHKPSDDLIITHWSAN